MSDIVRYKGKLIPVESVENIESFTRTVLIGKLGEEKTNNLINEGWHSSWEELLSDEFYEQYYINGKTIYRVYPETLDSEYDFFEANTNVENGYDFHVMYYNGGCCLSEALDYAIKDLKSK
jgi:hypothetical protein